MTITTDCASSSYLPPHEAGFVSEPGWGAVNDDRPGTAVVLTIVGPPGSLAALAAQLPEHWTVRGTADDDGSDTDLLVITSATSDRISAAVHRHPHVPVVGIVDTLASVEQVVEVLEAGADACVRSGQPALVSSHLRACHRRRMVAA